MIFALGSVSGAHFNPAVTVAIDMSGRDCCTSQHGELHCFADIWWSSWCIQLRILGKWKNIPLEPWCWSFLVCYIVLCVATVKNPPTSNYFGLVIGACVTTGGYAIGALSGGSLNPAVSVGISTSHILNGGNFWHCLVYSVFEIFGGLIAVGIFRVTHAEEYAPKDEGALS